jgi:hypothetical protein
LIDKATSKLAGKTKKDADWVKALEIAFERANEGDLGELGNLKADEKPQNWERAFRVIRGIDRRQEKVYPLTPLIDENGHRATFEFIETAPMIETARTEAASHLYRQGSHFLDKARRGDRQAAREAYDAFAKVFDYEQYFKDAGSLQDEAFQLGITDISVQVENQSGAFMPAGLEQEIYQMLAKIDTGGWKRIAPRGSSNEAPDYYADILLKEISVSPEQVQEEIHHLEKQVEEVAYLRSENGEFLYDSLGNRIEMVFYTTARASVTELFQSKQSYIRGDVQVIDAFAGNTVLNEPFRGEFNFQNRAARYQGDERALGTWQKQIGEPVPFPTDEYMLIGAADQIGERLNRILLKSRDIF